MQHTDIPASGSYRVERISGLLPPGLGKTIDGDRGVTTLGGHPVASFGTAGRSLIYDWLPVTRPAPARAGRQLDRPRHRRRNRVLPVPAGARGHARRGPL